MPHGIAWVARTDKTVENDRLPRKRSTEDSKNFKCIIGGPTSVGMGGPGLQRSLQTIGHFLPRGKAATLSYRLAESGNSEELENYDWNMVETQ